MRRFWILLGVALCLSVALLVAVGCSDDDDNNPTDSQGDPPDLPPQSSFIMPMDTYDTTGQSSKFEPMTPEAQTIQAWLYSAGKVIFGGAATVVLMAVPSASFVAAFADLPAYDGDGWWAWEYSFSVADSLPIHTAKLKGRIVADSVEWEMCISKEGEYSNFLWYYGSHNVGATEGYWILKRDPDTPVEWLQIEWERDTTVATASIKYTIIESGAAFEDLYITYGNTTDTDYDLFYTIYDPTHPSTTNVEWHSTNLNGRVQDSFFFGDSDWHCWDQLLQDVDCP